MDTMGMFELCWPSPCEPVRSVWIRQESCSEQAGMLCCDDPLSTETLWNVSNNSKQFQTPCTASSHADPPNTPSPCHAGCSANDWSPYQSQVEFKLADFLYTHDQMLVAYINNLLSLLLPHLLLKQPVTGWYLSTVLLFLCFIFFSFHIDWCLPYTCEDLITKGYHLQ